MREKSWAQDKMAASDKSENIENLVLIINCSECLTSQDFITREYERLLAIFNLRVFLNFNMPITYFNLSHK